MHRSRDFQTSSEQQPPRNMQRKSHSRNTQEENEHCLIRLAEAYNEVEKRKQWMVRIGDANSKIDQRLIGQTYIINGPAQSGKTSLIYWALRDDEEENTAVVVVDCSLYRTQMQFIQKLTRQVDQKLGVSGVDRRSIASENIKFSQLNGVIRQKGRPVVLLIRNAERLVQYRKQILLYNLLEWIASDIKQYVGLVFTTRLIYFVQRFQKRVRSRLAAKHLTVLRPSVETLIQLLARRVECLCEQQSMGRRSRCALFEKVYRALHDNQKLVNVLQNNQQFAQKDIVYYLNAMKIVFSSFSSTQQITLLTDDELKQDIAIKLEHSFQAIFPFIPKNLLKTCTFPECIVMSIIHYMGVHQRTPYRFKTVYQIYLQFKTKIVTTGGTGSSFIYSKNVLQRAVLKLQGLKLIELDNRDESVWNCDIRCSIYPQDIEKALLQIKNLPQFLRQILQA